MDGPELPSECAFIWRLFAKMEKVTYMEIKAFIDVTGEFIDQWEIELLFGFQAIKNGDRKWQRSQS